MRDLIGQVLWYNAEENKGMLSDESGNEYLFNKEAWIDSRHAPKHNLVVVFRVDDKHNAKYVRKAGDYGLSC